MTLSLHGYVISNNKLKTLYLLFHKTYDHQTFKDWGLGWEARGYQVTLTFDYKIKFQMKNLAKDSDFYSTRLKDYVTWEDT